MRELIAARAREIVLLRLDGALCADELRSMVLLEGWELDFGAENSGLLFLGDDDVGIFQAFPA